MWFKNEILYSGSHDLGLLSLYTFWGECVYFFKLSYRTLMAEPFEASFRYRHSSYNAVLLYRGIPSNAVFSKPKTALKFYLTQFFHKIRKTFAKEKFSDSIFLKCNKSLSKHLNPSSHYIFTVIYSCLLERQLFWLKLSDWINSSSPFLYRIFCSKSGLWK